MKNYNANGIAELDLTEMEAQVLKALISELYAEPGFSDVGVRDLSDITKIPMNSIRGVMGSLIKKGILAVYEVGAECPIVYLETSFWYLHSEEWAEEASDPRHQ